MTRDPAAWGVRLERVGRAIVVAPAGRFDAAEVQRLRDVLESRRGAYESVVVDLRDVVDVGEPGLKLRSSASSRSGTAFGVSGSFGALMVSPLRLRSIIDR